MDAFRNFATVLCAACAAHIASATDIYTSNFNDYGQGTLSGQLAWLGVGGSWAVSGSMNSPQIAANLIGPGVNPGVSPIGGTGLMVRICTEKFNAGRTKAWLDLSNSGKWATASAGGKDVLETSVKMFMPSGQAVTSTFGIMIARSSFETGGGFVVSAQTGAISLLSGGYAVGNRTATGATDAAPGTGNAFAFFEDLALRALPTVTPCPADISGDGQVNGTDLASVLGSWGGLGGDLDGNGVTDGADLSIVLGSWGPCP